MNDLNSSLLFFYETNLRLLHYFTYLQLFIRCHKGNRKWENLKNIWMKLFKMMQKDSRFC